MVGAALGREGTKLLEDGLDEVRFECGHGACSFRSGSVENSPHDVASVPALRLDSGSLLTEALSTPRHAYPVGSATSAEEHLPPRGRRARTTWIAHPRSARLPPRTLSPVAANELAYEAPALLYPVVL